MPITYNVRVWCGELFEVLNYTHSFKCFCTNGDFHSPIRETCWPFHGKPPRQYARWGASQRPKQDDEEAGLDRLRNSTQRGNLGTDYGLRPTKEEGGLQSSSSRLLIIPHGWATDRDKVTPTNTCNIRWGIWKATYLKTLFQLQKSFSVEW